MWLPLFHYAQAIAVRLGAGFTSVRIFDAFVAATTPMLLFAFLTRRRRSTPDEAMDATPILAALLAALSPIALQLGTTGQTEPLFALGTLAVIVFLDARRHVAASLTLSALVLLRYEAWAIIPAIVVIAAVDRVRHRRSAAAAYISEDSEGPASRLDMPSSRWLVFVMPTVAILGWAAIRRYAPQGDGTWFWFLGATKKFAQDAQGTTGPRGVGQLLHDIVYYPVLIPWQCVGWPLLLAPFGVLRTIRREGTRFLVVYAMVLGFVSYAWLTRSSLGLHRHFVVLVPFYATLVANGAVTLGELAARFTRESRESPARERVGKWVVALTGVIAVGLTCRMLVAWMADWRDKTLHIWPDRRAIAEELRKTAPGTTIFCDEASIEVLSGVDRRRFERDALGNDEATTTRVLAAAARDGEAWVVGWGPRLVSLRALRPSTEVILPRPLGPAYEAGPMLLHVAPPLP